MQDSRSTRDPTTVHRAVRRSLTTAGASLVVVGLLAGPAWAAPSFTSGAEAQAGAEGHAVTMQVPDVEQTGPTSAVVMTAPNGFVPSGCIGPVGWTCAVEGRRITWTRGAVGQLGAFGFQLAVPAAAGTYPFPVQQTGDAGAVTWSAGNGAPVLTVVAAQPPPDEGEESPPEGEEPPPNEADDPPPAADDPPAEDTSGNGSGDASSPAPAPSPAASAAVDGGGQADDDEQATTSTGGSTAPTRTQGRSSGTTLDVTPGESAAGDPDPAVAAPDVADDPAVASAPGDAAADLDGDAAAAGAATDAPAGDRPWQQLVGAALLLAGAGIVGYRRWQAR